MLVALDTVSGTVSSIPLGQSVMSGGIFGTDADGDKLVLFAVEPDTIMRVIVLNVRTGQSRTIPLTSPLCSTDCALAGDAMLAHGVAPPRLRACTGRSLDIVDLQSGVIRQHVFDVPFGSGQRIATNASGTLLWVGTAQPGFEASPGIRLYDVVTGELRVRAFNYAGKGAYTEDLTIVVP